MVKTMFLKDVLQEMKKLDEKKNPVPFSISVRNYNKQNKEGGDLKHYHNVTLMQAPKVKGSKRLSDTTPFKNPNHFENRTRNLKTSEGIKKINILFIINFNGHLVVY